MPVKDSGGHDLAMSIRDYQDKVEVGKYNCKEGGTIPWTWIIEHTERKKLAEHKQ